MPSKTTWILIADGARARIAVAERGCRAIKPAFAHDFAAPHAPTRRLVSDRPGRYPLGITPARQAVDARTDRHAYEKTAFTRDIAGVVDRAALQRAFDRLVLVAPPAELGRLRTMLKPRTRAMIVAEIAKDLTHLPLHAVGDRLAETIRI